MRAYGQFTSYIGVSARMAIWKLLLAHALEHVHAHASRHRTCMGTGSGWSVTPQRVLGTVIWDTLPTTLYDI